MTNLAISILILLILAVESRANVIELQPFKDELFSNTNILSESHGGSLRIYDYDEMRDVNGRDVIPVTRANPRYVQPIDPSEQRELNLLIRSSLGSRTLETFEVGRAGSARFAVIFIHGANGSRDLAMKDWTFSGNFNRLKNLVIQNGGSYYSPTVRTFDQRGNKEIAELIEHISRVSPGAPIVLACASSGGAICASIARTPAAVRHLGGLALIGTAGSSSIYGSAAHQKGVPLLFAHGTRDSLCPMASQVAAFESFLRADPAYPTIFQAFSTGGHGTPIRMIDWRLSLNWIFSRR